MDRVRAVITLVLAVTQIIAPAFLFPRGSQVDVSGAPVDPTPIVPAGYAFSIWGVIYLGALASAIVGVVPRYTSDPVLRRIGWLTAITYAGSTVWLLFARFGPNWLTLPVIVVMLAAAGGALSLAARSPVPVRPLLRWLVVVPLGLYAGWLSVAAFANLSEVLAGLRAEWFTRALVPWTLVLLTLATLVAAQLIVRSRGSIAYTAAVVWGLVAIGVARGEGLVAWAAGAAAVVLLLVLVLVLRRVRAQLPA